MSRIDLAFQVPKGDAEPAQSDASDPDKPVSEVSCFGDTQWRFTSKTAGRPGITLTWSHVRPEGSEIEEDEWLDLVTACKVFVETCRTVSVRGKPLKVDTLPTIHGCLTYLMRWMALTDHATFEELDEEAIEAFLEHLETNKAGISHATLAVHIDVLCRIYELRDSLAFLPGGRTHSFQGRA